jgi:cell division protein FtsZ
MTHTKKRFFTLADEERDKVKLSANLKVVGVGGGGCNAIDYMIKKGLQGVEYIAVNTDAQVLEASLADKKLQIGVNITRGLGAGADPNVGKKAIEENKEDLKAMLEGSDMVFITAGMGGGTGTGSAPIVAEEAKSLGALVVGVVTEPFAWEGKQRMNNAKEGIAELNKHVDSLIVIPNNRLLNSLDNSTSAFDAFSKPNEVLLEATQGIADIITIRGIINVDFADVRRVMSLSGKALMGRGTASGDNRSIEAAEKAISSPLLEGMSIKGAKKVLINITGSSNLTMNEIEAGNNIIMKAVGDEADIIFGWVVKEDMGEFVSYTVIATGFETKRVSTPKPQPEPQISVASHVANSEATLFDDTADEAPTVPPIFGGFTEDDSSLTANFESEAGGYFNSFEAEKAKEKKKNKKKSDSSSFLRMIMD